MTEGEETHGGCACGAVRYRLTSQPFEAGYCHCRLCQQTSGAPAVAFATVPLDDFQWQGRVPARWRSTSFGERLFCPDCGSLLAMRVDHEPDTIDFTVATLDDPAAAAPTFHIWTRSRIPWFDTRDEHPRHATDRSGKAPQ